MSSEVVTSPKQQQQRDDHLIDPLMRSFMYGQFANLFKFAFWWVALSPLLYAITDNSSTAIGVGRIVYNTALCLASPLGPLLIEHISPRTILLGAAGTRFVVWSILLPLNWVLFDSDLTDSKSIVGVYAMIVIMLILDGFSVGLSSVLDIDFMGVDILAGFLGREVTEEHRNQFNSRNELFFAVCFVFFSPAMAFMGLGLRDAFDNYRKDDENDRSSNAFSFAQVQSGTLSAIFVISFLVATIIQFYYFWGLTPENAQKIDDELMNQTSNSNLHSSSDERSMGTSRPLIESSNNNNNNGNDDDLANQSDSPGRPAAEGGEPDEQNEEEEPEGPKTTCEIMCGILGDLKESFFLVISHRAILFRLIFFGFELAFEDASIAVLAAQLGIHVQWLGNGDSVQGSIWTAILVAVGKLGAALASYLMMMHYKPPEDIMGHTKLFVSIGLSCLVILLVPIAFDAHVAGNLSDNGARAITFVSFMLYFFLSTLPKLGLMSLLQTMVSQVENGHRAFAFIAIVATTIDSIIIMGLSLLFNDAGVQSNESFSRSLWITCFVFLAHGLLETVFGPILILRPASEDAVKAKEIEAQQQTKEGQPQQEGGNQDGKNQKQQGKNESSLLNNNNVDDDVTRIKADLLADGNDLNTRQLNNSASNLHYRGGMSNLNITDESSINNANLAGSYSARAVAMPVAYTPRLGGSTLNYAAGGASLSARRQGGQQQTSTLQQQYGGGGGMSPRLGGIPIPPRTYQKSQLSGLQFSARGNNNNYDQQQQQQQGQTPGASSVMRQNMLGRSMHSAVAASNVVIPQRSGFSSSRLEAPEQNNNNNNNNFGSSNSPGDMNAGSYVRKGRPSTLNAPSGNNNNNNNTPRDQSDSQYGSV